MLLNKSRTSYQFLYGKPRNFEITANAIEAGP